MPHVELTYSQAKNLMKTARDPANGKPLQYATKLYDRGAYMAVQHHATDIVKIMPNGTFELSCGGHTHHKGNSNRPSVTTWARMTSYSPISWGTTLVTRDSDGDTELRVYARAKASDPEPQVPEIDIPNAYTCADPGPEPVKPNDGCVAGQRYARGHMANVMVRPNEVRANESWELPSYMRKPQPTRGRDVTNYIAAVERAYHVKVVRHCVELIDFGEASWRPYDQRSTVKYERCPHCAAHAKRHSAWLPANSRYTIMCDMLERFGSKEAWREEYLTQFRARREAGKLWKAWMLRNSIEYHDGIVINEDGYALRRVVDERNRENRRIARAQRKRELEMERWEREQRRDFRLWQRRQVQLQTNRRKRYRDEWPVARQLDNDTVDWLIEQMQPPAPQILIRRPYT